MKEQIKLIQLVVTFQDNEDNRKEIDRLFSEAGRSHPSTYKYDSIILREQTIIEFRKPIPKRIMARNEAKEDLTKAAINLIGINKKITPKKTTKKGKTK